MGLVFRSLLRERHKGSTMTFPISLPLAALQVPNKYTILLLAPDDPPEIVMQDESLTLALAWARGWMNDGDPMECGVAILPPAKEQRYELADVAGMKGGAN